MFVTYIKLKNWRNFRLAEVHLAQWSYVIGPNASGKSNLLDVFRFLRDISKQAGGGLQKAVSDRGGLSKLRCLHHRRDPEVRIEVHLSDYLSEAVDVWKYILGFRSEGKGAQRLIISTEQVWFGDDLIVSRPDDEDKADLKLLTETHLEQTRANRKFREIADYFGNITYLHLVPQLLKYGDKIGGNRLEDDPFGQGFLERIASFNKRTREIRLKKINKVLSIAVPHFNDLRFVQDEITGRPHLEALYEHHRPGAGWQREEHFSDGTLRLIGILWSLLDGDSLLLIEEPELSLHQSVVEQIPLLIDRVQREAKNKRQIIITTHSESLLKNTGISPKGLVILEPSDEGTVVRSVNEVEEKGLEAGLSIADVVLPKTKPKKIEQMSLW